MQVRAPGKLILSGEHAVVHGSPVLAMAVDCYTIFSLRADGPAFTLKLADLSFEQTYPLHIFPIIRATIIKHMTNVCLQYLFG